MYSNNQCAIKIGNKQREFFTQGRGVRQGCPLSPTLFNIYMNELAKVLEQSSAPGLTLHDSNIKFLLFADDLVLLSPTEEGLQQNLDILHKFCQTWALSINTNKTKILTFQKRPRLQGKRHSFTIGTTKIEHAKNLQIYEDTIKNNQNPLDFPITHEELTNKLKSQTCRKSCGPDSILGEMLKHSKPALQTAVLRLFNLVLSSGCSPDIWSQGLITPIHKSGDKLDPNNFRGICVSSNLGKLFSSILNNRIVNVLNEHNVLSPSQIGFLPNYRTTDHIYTLHTLINRHVKQTKNWKIFACFIDFKKAFESIWHDGLYYKFLQSGVGGKVYDIIKSMYSNNKCAIRIGNKHTDFFTQKRGVRQGCSLSPTSTLMN